jgi:hypothetical protein
MEKDDDRRGRGAVKHLMNVMVKGGLISRDCNRNPSSRKLLEVLNDSFAERPLANHFRSKIVL